MGSCLGRRGRAEGEDLHLRGARLRGDGEEGAFHGAGEGEKVINVGGVDRYISLEAGCYLYDAEYEEFYLDYEGYIEVSVFDENIYSYAEAVAAFEGILADLEIETTNNLCNLLRQNGMNTENLEEKIHLSYNLIDNYARVYMLLKNKLMLPHNILI